jgi:hypothetical protein
MKINKDVQNQIINLSFSDKEYFILLKALSIAAEEIPYKENFTATEIKKVNKWVDDLATEFYSAALDNLS